MQQLEIQYFFPLTEQIPLDLDFSPSEEYIKEQKRISLALSMQGSVTSMMLNSGAYNTTTSSTIAFIPSNDSVGYWAVGESLHMHSKKLPSWLHQKMTKIFFGWEWKDK